VISDGTGVIKLWNCLMLGNKLVYSFNGWLAHKSLFIVVCVRRYTVKT